MKSKLFISLSLLTAAFISHAGAQADIAHGIEALGSQTFETGGRIQRLNLQAGQVLASGLESCGTATSKAAMSPMAKFMAFGAAPVAVGVGAAYGAQAAYDYMYPAAIPVPVKPELTRFELAKTLFNNGYNSSVSFAKTYPKSIGAVAATAVIGSLAWKYRGSIFGKSKQVEVVTPVVTVVPVVKTQPRTTLTD